MARAAALTLSLAIAGTVATQCVDETVETAHALKLAVADGNGCNGTKRIKITVSEIVVNETLNVDAGDAWRARSSPTPPQGCT